MAAMRRLTVVAILAASVLAGCGGDSGAKPGLPETTSVAQSATGVKTIVPATRLEASVLRATGTVRSQQEASLSPQAPGTLIKVEVKVGDRVKKGQLLAQSDTSNLRISAQQANAAKALAAAALDGATLEVERARTLAKTGSLAQAMLDKAEIGFRQAEAGLAQATAALASIEEALRDASLVAPFNGVITERLKNVGDFVAPPGAVFSIVDVDNLEVRAQVPEAVIDRLRVGSTAKGTLNPSGRVFQAKVRNLGAVIDPKSRTVEVLADVIADGATLRPGALVELDFSERAGGEDPAAMAGGLFLPAKSVSANGQGDFVWIVRDGKAVRREVKVERVLPGYLRVVEGLRAEEQVIADASLPLQDGAAIRVVQ